MSLELVTSIPALAKSPTWDEAKRGGRVVLDLEEPLTVKLAEQPTNIGKMRFFYCPMPGCHRRARDLFSRDGGRTIGCRVCMNVRHPDAVLGTRFGRRVVLPARQIARIDERLQRRDLDRNYRRRLRRRRKRLLRQVESELARRRIHLCAALALALP